MAIHHHKPSTALARARQLRGYWSHLDSQIQKRETNKNKSKSKKKLRFDSNNNERKDLLIPVSPSVQALLSFVHETLLSSQLHKQNKNCIKENKKAKLLEPVSMKTFVKNISFGALTHDESRVLHLSLIHI